MISRDLSRPNFLTVLVIVIQLSVIHSTMALTPDEMAVIINVQDPLSIKIGEYYQQKRLIPEENVLRLSFIPGRSLMAPHEFTKLRTGLEQSLPSSIQAYALAWTLPFRVGCMSITTAFAAGYNQVFCSRTCRATQRSPYFNSGSEHPFNDFRWRPSMMLAARSFEQAKALIDRGVKADGTKPHGTAWLLNTDDKARNVRSVYYRGIIEKLSGAFNVNQVSANYLKNKKNILFYFTGTTSVAELKSNTFLPGAIADHLTSAGGVLNGFRQMSSLHWLEAGATGSYGTVVEPCNILAKFPHPGIVTDRYLKGDTLIEAYWKSVAQPGQGVFIGEPLARPFQKNKNKIK